MNVTGTNETLLVTFCPSCKAGAQTKGVRTDIGIILVQPMTRDELVKHASCDLLRLYHMLTRLAYHNSILQVYRIQGN